MKDPAARLKAIGRPLLMLVTEPVPGLPAIVSRAVRGGVDIVQWRVKNATADAGDMDPATLADLIRTASALWLAAGDALLIVNGPAWLASAASADGRHLPEDYDDDELGDGIVGRSVHSAEAAQAAIASRADYLIAGTIYASGSHPDRPPAGTGLLCAVREVAGGRPVLAIGGVTPPRAHECMASGAAGVAVISGILRAPDPYEAALAYRRALDTGLAAFRGDQE